MHNRDWVNGNNWRALRRRENGSKFKFIVWDAEYSMNPTTLSAWNMTGAIAGALEAHSKLINHPQYQAAFKARVQKHFYTSGGVFSFDTMSGDHQAAAIFQTQLDLFEEAVGTESARWGDSNRTIAFSVSEWLESGATHMEDFIEVRRNDFLTKLRAKNLAD